MIFVADTLRDRIATLLGATASTEPTQPATATPSYRVYLDSVSQDEPRETMNLSTNVELVAVIRVECIAQAITSHAAALSELVGSAIAAIAVEMDNLGGTGAILDAPAITYERSGDLEQPTGTASLVYRAQFGCNLLAPQTVTS